MGKVVLKEIKGFKNKKALGLDGILNMKFCSAQQLAFESPQTSYEQLHPSKNHTTGMEKCASNIRSQEKWSNRPKELSAHQSVCYHLSTNFLQKFLQKESTQGSNLHKGSGGIKVWLKYSWPSTGSKST